MNLFYLVEFKMELPTNFEFSPDEDQLLLIDENVVLEAIPSNLPCSGCWIGNIDFTQEYTPCFRYFKCSKSVRKDHTSIVWVEVK